VSLGLPFPFLIRLPACGADLVTTLLVFDLVRQRHDDRVALAAAAAFSFAPITIIVSGFHGNTDPVFVALALLSCWCLVARRAGLSAGVALGCAVSVKVVPVVLVPVLAIIAWRCGRSVLIRFITGGVTVFLALWAPVLIRQPSGFLHHVLGYSGTNNQWGIPQLVVVLSDMTSADTFLIGEHLKFVVVFIAAALPAWTAARSRASVPDLLPFAAMPAVLLLLLCSAFSMQYLVWPLALALVAAPLRLALSYVASASAFGFVVYCGWAGGLPWTWDETRFTNLPDLVLPLMFVTWLCLLRVGVAMAHRSAGTETVATPVPAVSIG
jgi:uncharacterized membrane protein